MPSDLQITNLKALDGTAGISIADSTGNVSLNGTLSAGTFDFSGITISNFFKAGTFTFPQAHNGATSYTGIGFQPTFLECWCHYGTTPTSQSGGSPTANGILRSHGWTDGTTTMCIHWQSRSLGNMLITTNDSDTFADANCNNATFTSFDSDGFTILYTKIGSPSTDHTVYYRAWRGPSSSSN